MSIQIETPLYDQLLIAGSLTVDDTRTVLPVVNPATEEVIAHVATASVEDAEAAVDAAVHAFEEGEWLRLTFSERAKFLTRLADLLIENIEEIADAYVQDQGGISRYSSYIARTAEQIVRYYADLGKSYPDGPETRSTFRGEILVQKVPVGPVFASVPWNSPLILSLIKLAPALLAGNPVIVKCDPQAPVSAMVLARILAELELPRGVVSLFIAEAEVGKLLVAHPAIKHVTFTGSTQVGRQVAHSAIDNFTRFTLELGGKGAALILDDLEPADSAPLIYGSCMMQSGQVCTTSSRLLVPVSRYEEWKEAIASQFAGFVLGDPREEETVIGPLITAAHRDRVESFIRGAIDQGATIVTGGGRPNRPGFFIEPTLVADVTNDMTIVQEEVFGPVITLQSYRDIDHAVELVNSTAYGLANSILTNDVDRALSLTRRLRSGTVSINNTGATMTAPFGGMGASGYGREGGVEGMEAFLETQQVQFPGSR